MATALRLTGVGHAFDRGAPVLDGVDLAVEPGEVVAVTGPNGSGKTTLLRLAVGVLAARRGRVVRRAPVGYLPQATDDPPPRLSAATWARALARITGRPAPDGTALAALGIGDPGRPMDALSVGTVTKVVLAVALAGPPRLVVLDEPFAALDDAGRVAAADLVATAAEAGAAVLLTDHEGTGATVATRSLQLADGRLHPTARDRAGAPQWRLHLRAAGGPVRAVTVDAGARDATLRAALDAGDEVLRVEPLP